MNIFNSAQVEKKLKKGIFSEKEMFQIFFTWVFLFFGTSLVVAHCFRYCEWTFSILHYALGLNILFAKVLFNLNKKGDGKHFLMRYLYISSSIGIRIFFGLIFAWCMLMIFQYFNSPLFGIFVLLIILLTCAYPYFMYSLFERVSHHK